MGDVKVALLERDGVELDYKEEYSPNADDVDFSAVGFSATKVRQAIEEAQSVPLSLPRIPFVLVHNGNLNNGQPIRWSSLTNNSPVVVPVKSVLSEITFSNTRSNADADFRFYRNSVTPGNLFFTWTAIRNVETLIATSADFQSNPTFLAGDKIEIEFDDQGRNPRDMVMTLYFQAVQ